MRKSYLRLVSFIVTSVMIGGLAACSGGGGGASSGGGNTATPTTSNAAPVANISIDDTSIDERQVIELSAEGSSDPDGDSLTYQWAQTGGPTLNLASASNANFSVQVPELTADETYTFELTVSDGALSRSTTVEIVGQNIVRTPVSVEWGTDLGSFSVPGTIVPPFWIFNNQVSGDYVLVSSFTTVEDGGVDQLTQYNFRRSGFGAFSESFSDQEGATFEGEFIAPVQFAQTSGIYDDSYQLLPTQNGVEVRDSFSPGEVVFLDTQTTPCAVFHSSIIREFDEVENRLLPSNLPNIFVALETGGLMMFQNSGNAQPNERGWPDSASADEWHRYEAGVIVKSDGDYCSGASAEMGHVLFGADDTAVGRERQFLLFNAETQAFEFISTAIVGEVSGIQVTQTVPINETVDVRALAKNLDSSFGPSDEAEGFVAVGMTSGEHEGRHFVAVIDLESAAITKLDLQNGVPSEVIVIRRWDEPQENIANQNFGRIYGSLPPDILVASPETPYITFFENNLETLVEDDNAMTFRDPQFIEVGFGATYLAYPELSEFDDDLYIAFPEAGEVRVLSGLLSSY